MPWEKRSPAMGEAPSSALFSCWMREKLYQNSGVMRATVAVHRSALTKKADFSPSAHTVPRKPAHMPHCQPQSGWLLGKSHTPLLKVIRLVAKKQRHVTKGRSSDPRVLMRKTRQSYWLTLSLESTFLHSSPEIFAPGTMITGGELMLVMNLI